MAISKIKVGNIEHELKTTAELVDGLQAALDSKFDKTGGSISGTVLITASSEDTPLHVVSKTVDSYISFSNSSLTLLGFIGVNANKQPVFYNDKEQIILHLGNYETYAVPRSLLGTANGVATLDENMKVPISQLPSYVDDVLEYTTKSSFPANGETSKIYVDTTENKTYRWGGSSYVEISASLALGETSSTAFYGDKGKTAYEHTTKTNNPHQVSLSQLGVSASATELNYLSGASSNIQAQINKKANDFSIEIYNGTGGNPKPVRFASFNYSTCASESGIAAKISLVSGHGNGTHYAFLEDVIIKVNYLGTVEVDNFKYYGASTDTYDGAARQYGDIFWVIDTTNKIVDFYVLMGQWSRVYQTPWKRLTYSTGGTVTQYTSCTVYSSGDKNWANNSEYALMSDVTSQIQSALGDIGSILDAINGEVI